MRIALYCLCWSLLWMPLVGLLCDPSTLLTGWSAPVLGFRTVLSAAGWQGAVLQTITLPCLSFWTGIAMAFVAGTWPSTPEGTEADPVATASHF